MNVAAAVNNIEFLLAIAALLWIFYGPWQGFVVDILRQNLFRQRDEIFLLAADGKLDFESAEYKEIRDRFNAMIRFAHTATWSQLLAFLIVEAKTPSEPVFRISEFVTRIQNREAAKKIYDNYTEAILFMMLAIIGRSFFLIVANMIVSPILLIAILLDIKWVKRRLAIPIGRVIERDVEVEDRKLSAAA